MDILIDEQGDLHFVYTDTLAEVFADEPAQTTRRVSHVEPSGQQWTADMSPVDGPLLGPFVTRQEALDAEREWLRRERDL